MRIAFLAASASAAVAFGTPGTGTAQSLPLADGTPSVTLVAQGCGLGYSRGAYGRCRPSVFGFGVPGARRYGYGYPPYGYGYGYTYRPYRYGY